MLRFPNHNKPFEIYTDASNFQLGATIKQNNLPIAYFSKKLTPTQRRYSAIEQEMLTIVQVLKEYRNFLLGSQITIYINHKNLLASSSTNDRVFRWKQKIEEFAPTLHYVKGHTMLESWFTIPLFPVGIFLGWGERQMLICCVNLFIYFRLYKVPDGKL